MGNKRAWLPALAALSLPLWALIASRLGLVWEIAGILVLHIALLSWYFIAAPGRGALALLGLLLAVLSFGGTVLFTALYAPRLTGTEAAWGVGLLVAGLQTVCVLLATGLLVLMKKPKASAE